MEDLYDPEEKILCPYNKSHHIRRCKMAFHLVKCKKNYGEQKMVPCDFNATHMIPEPELRYHHQICSDRKSVEAPIVATQKRTDRFPIPKIDVAVEESWDDLDVPTYDPKAYTEKSNVLRHLDVESSAKRREFRLNERARLNQLDDNTPTQSQTYSVPLPQHRPATNITENRRINIQERISAQGKKPFLQFTKNE
ncbi:gametocyte-specific factor 1 homolog [Tribolium madens]|uniref:gametocyte-specific factor 1 homolog n=1 Tax=Tribolium madens TaxID=41895 RepID=UPI001CF72917|nr:gametocyte-specific factor 1 homolog [Tribolium madens]XP_044259710.1 gametocyte-specific factor 1 homolog [Tribolium madens]